MADATDEGEEWLAFSSSNCDFDENHFILPKLESSEQSQDKNPTPELVVPNDVESMRTLLCQTIQDACTHGEDVNAMIWTQLSNESFTLEDGTQHW